jgi:hypothetical protein
MVFEVPTAYLLEYSKAMETKFGITLSKATISTFLNVSGINRKKVLNSKLTVEVTDK